MVFIAAYTGARPLGRPLPPLHEAPQGCEAAPLHLIYSFARDAAHDGRFEFYDPWQLEQACRQQCGVQRGMLSLAGSGFAWGPAVPLEAWVAAAVESLRGLMDRYGLVGLDINYEEGLEGPAAAASFAQAMAALISALKAWRTSLLITIAPYYEVWQPYRQLLQLAGGNIDYINWQVYAELESPDATAEQVVAVYDRLARELGGYSKLTLGINTEPDQKRGPQLGASLAAFRQLSARGIGGAFIWALENSCSCACAYQAEAALLRMAAEQQSAAADEAGRGGGAAAADVSAPSATAASVIGTMSYQQSVRSSHSQAAGRPEPGVAPGAATELPSDGRVEQSGASAPEGRAEGSGRQPCCCCLM